VSYHPGSSIDLTGTNKWLADDTNPAEQPDRNLNIVADQVVEAVNDDQSFADLSKAHVKYTSDNPAVASVDGSGLVARDQGRRRDDHRDSQRRFRVGAIVVTGTLTTNTVPTFLDAGSSGTATATFTNGSPSAVRSLTVDIAVPAGWTTTPTTPTSYRPGARDTRRSR